MDYCKIPVLDLSSLNDSRESLITLTHSVDFYAELNIRFYKRKFYAPKSH
jgi:hypothetical protein